MKVSDIIKELERYIEIDGDREINCVDINTKNSFFSTEEVSEIVTMNNGKGCCIILNA